MSDIAWAQHWARRSCTRPPAPRASSPPPTARSRRRATATPTTIRVSSHLLRHHPCPQYRPGAGRGQRPAALARRPVGAVLEGQDGLEAERPDRRARLHRQCAHQHGRGARHGLPARPAGRTSGWSTAAPARCSTRRINVEYSLSLQISQSPRRYQRRQGSAGQIGCGSIRSTVSPGLVGMT